MIHCIWMNKIIHTVRGKINCKFYRSGFFTRLLFRFSPSAYFCCVRIATKCQVKKSGGLTPSRRGDKNQKVVKIGKTHGFWPQISLLFPPERLDWPKVTAGDPQHVVWCVGFKPGLSGHSGRVVTTYISHFWRWKWNIKIRCRLGFTNIASSPQLAKFSKIIE